MLSTIASQATYLRLSLILCLSILLYGSPASCQDLGSQQTVEATNVSAIVYNPPLNDPTWTVSKRSDSLKAVSTVHHSASAGYQFRGISVIFLADPENFDAKKIVVTVDSQPTPVETSPLLTEVDDDGLFTIFSTSGLSSTELHNISIHRDPSVQGTWNLVRIKFTPLPSSSTTSTLQAITPPAAASSTPPASTPIGTLSIYKKNNAGKIAGAVVGTLVVMIVIAFVTFCFHRRIQAQKRALLADPLVIEKPSSAPAAQTNRSFLKRMHSRRLPRFVAPPSVWPSSRSSSEYNELPHSADHRRQGHQRVPQPNPDEKAHPTQSKRPRSSFFITNPNSVEPHGGSVIRSATSPPLAAHHPRPLGRIAESIVSSVPTEKWIRDRKEIAKGKARAVPGAPRTSKATQPKERMSRSRSLRAFFTTNPSPSTYSSSTTSSKRSKELKTQPERPRSSQQMRQATPPIPLPTATGVAGIERSPTPNRTGSPANGKPREKPVMFFTTNPSPPSIPDPTDMADVESVVCETPRPRLDKGKGRAL